MSLTNCYFVHDSSGFPVLLRFEPGQPVQNAFIESFNGKFRDDCLDQNWFVSLDDARRIIEAWRVDYDTVRPHSNLGCLTPEEFAASAAARPASSPRRSHPQPGYGQNRACKNP